MINRAIERITEEMMKSQEPYIVAIEEHLTSICTTEAVAAKLLADGKTLAGAFGEVEKEARRRQKYQKACIVSTEAFQIIEDYYGITDDDKDGKVRMTRGAVIDITDLL